MKIDIENKILIPFIVLISLSIMSLGIISYWSGYKLLLDRQKLNAKENIREILYFIEDKNKEVKEGEISLEEAKKMTIEYYENLKQPGLIIADRNKKVINHFNKRIVKDKNIVSIHEIYDPWGWTITYNLNKNIFSEELIDIEKYTLLVAIIFLILSMQATILIAYNISKPIKILANICNKIANGNLEDKIMIKRSDEIGILADSFNNMIEKLQLNTYKLIEVKQFNEDILRNISTGIITIDREESIVSKNQAAEDMLKYNLINLEDNTKAEEIILKQLKNTLIVEENINNTYKFMDLNNNDDYYLDVVTSILRTSKNKIGGAICSFNNITERKQIEKNIEKVNRLTSMGQLAAGMAHEIRNPLSGMKMSIQVLKKRLYTSYSKSNEDLFDGVLYEIDRLNSLITDLLNFAKPRLPSYETINTMEILNKALYLTQKSALKNGIKICVEEDFSELLIYVDKDQIEQVFLNIITNGLKAIGSNGILDIKLKHSVSEKGNFVEIEFSDNGCGIKAEYIDKIFDPFFTTNSQGTGLGLSVVHKLVAENNGEIEVKSKESIGTSFKIIFPIHGGDECGKKYFNN